MQNLTALFRAGNLQLPFLNVLFFILLLLLSICSLSLITEKLLLLYRWRRRHRQLPGRAGQLLKNAELEELEQLLQRERGPEAKLLRQSFRFIRDELEAAPWGIRVMGRGMGDDRRFSPAQPQPIVKTMPKTEESQPTRQDFDLPMPNLSMPEGEWAPWSPWAPWTQWAQQAEFSPTALHAEHNSQISRLEHWIETCIEELSLQLEKHCNFFHLIANVATLLGLLGTVTGMIYAFHTGALEQSTQLAQGISQALGTTAGGLIVAIPAIISQQLFLNASACRVSVLEQLGHDILLFQHKRQEQQRGLALTGQIRASERLAQLDQQERETLKAGQSKTTPSEDKGIASERMATNMATNPVFLERPQEPSAADSQIFWTSAQEKESQKNQGRRQEVRQEVKEWQIRQGAQGTQQPSASRATQKISPEPREAHAQAARIASLQSSVKQDFAPPGIQSRAETQSKSQRNIQLDHLGAQDARQTAAAERQDNKQDLVALRLQRSRMARQLLTQGTLAPTNEANSTSIFTQAETTPVKEVPEPEVSLAKNIPDAQRPEHQTKSQSLDALGALDSLDSLDSLDAPDALDRTIRPRAGAQAQASGQTAAVPKPKAATAQEAETQLGANTRNFATRLADLQQERQKARTQQLQVGRSGDERRVPLLFRQLEDPNPRPQTTGRKEKKALLEPTGQGNASRKSAVAAAPTSQAATDHRASSLSSRAHTPPESGSETQGEQPSPERENKAHATS